MRRRTTKPLPCTHGGLHWIEDRIKGDFYCPSCEVVFILHAVPNPKRDRGCATCWDWTMDFVEPCNTCGYEGKSANVIRCACGLDSAGTGGEHQDYCPKKVIG